MAAATFSFVRAGEGGRSPTACSLFLSSRRGAGVGSSCRAVRQRVAFGSRGPERVNSEVGAGVGRNPSAAM
jgi:hypothetical protein